MYKPKEMAELLGVTVRTLQRWDKAGTLIAYRTPTNRRYYTQEQLEEYFIAAERSKDKEETRHEKGSK